MISYV